MASAAKILLDEAINKIDIDIEVNAIVDTLETQLNEQKSYQLSNQSNFKCNNQLGNNNNHSSNNSVAISNDQLTSNRHQQQGIEGNQIFTSNNNNNSINFMNNNNNINFSKENIVHLNNQVIITGHNHYHHQQQQQQQQQRQLQQQQQHLQNQEILISEATIRQQQQHQQQHQQNYQQQGQNNYHLIQNMPKSNEPIKLVYPISSSQQQLHHSSPQSQASIVTMNSSSNNLAGNRVTFTSQSLPNGALNLTSQSQQQMMHAVSASGIQNATSGTTIKTITTGAGGAGQQQQQQNQTGSNPTTGATTQTLGNQQNLVGTPTMIPASVQIVGMRPGTPTQNQQKTVASLSPRVVIGGPHMVGNRPASPAITFSALQNLQSGQSGPALILKTENGQYQLLRVAPQTAAPVATQNMTNTGNQTIRLQTVPAVSRFTGPPLALRKTIVTQHQVKQKQNQQAIATSATNIVVNSVTSTNATQASLSAQQNSTVQHNTISSVAPALAQATHHPPQQLHQQTQHQQIQIQQQNTTSNSGTIQTTSNSVTQGNTKEKCRKFLANLIELSSREPKPVERNVRTLIQELIDANVEPEEFCDRLERLLNASPQPCLIGFLKKSLPLLRQSLFTKELVIEGIKPPPQNVVGIIGSTLSTQLPKIQAQIRPIGQQTTTIGQTQVRMVTPGPRPIGHTTITKQIGGGVRIQGPIQTSTGMTTTGPRLLNAQIRPVSASSAPTALIQTSSIQSPPALQPVSGAQTIFTPSPNVVQIRTSSTVSRPPATLHIRATTPAAPRAPAPTIKNAGTTAITQVKVGQTQIKQIPAQPQNVAMAPPVSNNITSISSSNSTQASTNANNSSNNNKVVTIKAQIVNKVPAKEKEKKSSLAASSALYQQSSMSMSSASMEMDDINDVAAMGGVNLLEESQRILGSTEMIGTQIRSCKDEVFLHLPALQSRIRAMVAERGLEEPSQEVAVLVSHACQERLKNIVEKLAVIAEHRIDIIKIDPRYEVTKDVRGQIKFLEELDKAEAKRHEEQEREMLLRAAKSRAKAEDPEQAKLKAKAKEMQRAEMEELRQRDANMTALQAIGPRKKPKLDGDATVVTQTGITGIGNSNISTTPMRPRIKRVNLRDMLFFMEQERDLCRSTMLYKAYLK